jgi:hypothetical protein
VVTFVLCVSNVVSTPRWELNQAIRGPASGPSLLSVPSPPYSCLPIRLQHQTKLRSSSKETCCPRLHGREHNITACIHKVPCRPLRTLLPVKCDGEITFPSHYTDLQPCRYTTFRGIRLPDQLVIPTGISQSPLSRPTDLPNLARSICGIHWHRHV